MTLGKYTPMEHAANKWLKETDTIQFSQMELLSMFAESQLKEVKAENKKLKSQAVMVDTSDPFEYVLHQNNNKDTYSYNPQLGNGEMLNDFLLNTNRQEDITK